VADGEASNEIALQRYELLKRLVPILWIATLWLPVHALQPIARSLAGEDTNVTITFTVTLGITLALGAGAMALLRRSSEQRGEIIRLRRRCANLEKELKEARSQS